MYGLWKAEIIGHPSRRARPLPWCARLDGLDDDYGFKREFLWGVRDYTYGEAHHSRDVYLYFLLPPGLYDTWRPVSWKHGERQYYRVDNDGVLHKITREEAKERIMRKCTRCGREMLDEIEWHHPILRAAEQEATDEDKRIAGLCWECICEENGVDPDTGYPVRK